MRIIDGLSKAWGEGLIKHIIFALCILSFTFLFATSSLAAYVPGEIVVKFKPGVVKLPAGVSAAAIREASISLASVKSLNAKFGVVKIEQVYKDALTIRPDWKHLENDYILVFPQDKNVDQAIKEYKLDPGVASASPNTIVKAFTTTPNDTYYSEQWGLTKVEAGKGWDRTTGSASLEVAVIDTGINYNHEDFPGKIDLARAKDYVNDDNDPWDDNGHGTAVSSIIGAVSNNAKGMAGVDWGVKILPLKALDSSGTGTITNVNKAIAYATALRSGSGINIAAINMSLGQYDADTDLQQRCQEAYNQGIVVVAAAGNDNKEQNTYPACYSTVMGVAATDTTDTRSVWNASQASNYGIWVDVSAPGTSIFCATKDGSYSSNWNGTSQATPFVAGLASLLAAANPSFSNAQIIERIKSTTDNIDAQNPGYIGKLGTGRINIYKALMEVNASILSPVTGECVKGTVEIIGTAEGWNFLGYRLEAFNNTLLITIESSAVSVTAGKIGSWNTVSLTDGAYQLHLTAFGTDASTSEARALVIVDNTSPEVSITAPVSGATVDGQVSITGKAKDTNFNYYTLEYGSGTTPAAYQNIGTYYSPVDGGALGVWETAGLSGAYTLKLTARDRAGNISTISLPLNLSGQQSPEKKAQAQGSLPLTYILPNPFNRTVTAETSFCYSLAGNFSTTIYLFDLNGSMVWQKSYVAGENGAKAGANNPAWNGKSLFGENVVNGVYLYQIIADKKIVARGKIIVIN